MNGRSLAWKHLAGLAVGDLVPAELYVKDYADGTRPAWTVAEAEELDTGGRVLVLIDPGNDAAEAPDLFGPREPVALRVVTHPNKTLRTQPFLYGTSDPLPTLCDLDQQGRRDG